MRTHTTHRTTRAATTLAAAALLLTACTGDPEPPKTVGSSSNSSTDTTASPTLSDESQLVYSAPVPQAQGSTTGTVQREKYPATLNVGTITAGPDSTILTYWLTGQPDRFLGELSRPSNWPEQPSLVDPNAQKIYQPVTFTKDGTTYCVCTQRTAIQNAPQLRTITYPPIPAGVTTVQVKMTGFAKPITAKITRLP